MTVAYLGFDPDRLARLLFTLDDLADEARRLRSDDLEAQGPLADYQRAARLLCDFRPYIVAAQVSTFLHPIRWSSPALGLDRPVFHRGDGTDAKRWRFVAEEPWSDTVKTDAAAVALAQWLDAADLYDLCADASAFDAFAGLAARVLGTPRAADSFVRALGADEFGSLVAEASSIADEHNVVEHDRGARANTLVELLGRALAGFDTSSDDNADQPWLDAVTERSQEGAAWLAATGRLNDDQLSRLAISTFRAFVVSGVVHPTLDADGAYGDLVSSLLAKSLTARPVAARAFANSLTSDEWFRLVRTTGAERLGPLLLVVTSPELFTRASSAPLIVIVARTLDIARDAAEGIRGSLGALFGPWLLQLVPLPPPLHLDLALQPDLSSIDWGATHRMKLLRFAAGDPRSARDLSTWMQAWSIRGTWSALQNAVEPDRALGQLGLVLGEVADAIRDGAVAEATRLEQDWHTLFSLEADGVASALSVALSMSGGVAGFVVSEVLKAIIVHVLDERLQAMAGILPVDQVAVTELARARVDHILFVTAVAEVAHRHAVATGALPGGSAPPPVPSVDEIATISLAEVHDRLLVWAQAPGVSAAARRQIYGEVAAAGDGYLASFSKLAWTFQPSTPR